MVQVGCILSELLTSTPIPARCGGGVFAFNAALVQKTIDDSVKACPRGRVICVCLPRVSASCVCRMCPAPAAGRLICLPDMSQVKASPSLGRVVAQLLVPDPAKRPSAEELVSMLAPAPLASAVCLTCLPCMSALYVCLTCLPCMSALHVCRACHR